MTQPRQPHSTTDQVGSAIPRSSPNPVEQGQASGIYYPDTRARMSQNPIMQANPQPQGTPPRAHFVQSQRLMNPPPQGAYAGISPTNHLQMQPPHHQQQNPGVRMNPMQSNQPPQQKQEYNIYANEPEDFIHEIGKGYVVLINNVEFHSGQSIRKGSEKDVEAIKSFFFGTLNWDTDVDLKEKKDLKADEIMDIAKEVGEKDFSKYDALFFIVLSHGDERGILGIDDRPVSVDDVLKPFRPDHCKTLAKKPKNFIFQACRGPQDDPGATVKTDANNKTESKFIHIPLESDFLIAYPCAPGRTALRDEKYGSWFIQAIVHVFKCFYDREHLVDMFIRVNYLVCHMHDPNFLVETPCLDMRLTKRCYFRQALKDFQKFQTPKSSPR